jgi:hypothetical protein
MSLIYPLDYGFNTISEFTGKHLPCRGPYGVGGCNNITDFVYRSEHAAPGAYCVRHALLFREDNGYVHADLAS